MTTHEYARQLLSGPDEPMERDTRWSAGHRAAWVRLLNLALRELGIDDPEAGKARWASEREETIACLRDACETFGDNDWPSDLHLRDVIDKHLLDYWPEEDPFPDRPGEDN